ncbi:MAG: tetraacyldisaccharide 4'-kinase [Bacteroidota bacterium]
MRLLSLLLFPFSILYAFILFLRRKLYALGFLSSYDSSLPVISVGNLSTGGTGKTPFSEWLIRYLLALGKKPAYLSRGYGRETKGLLGVNPLKGDAAQFGDEALQVALKFPTIEVVVSENRKVGLQYLEQKGGIDVVILDDAFQHVKVKRDLDLVMVDAQRMPDEDFVLPMGSLREGRQSLKKADLIVLNKLAVGENPASKIKRLAAYNRHVLAIKPVFQTAYHFSGEALPAIDKAGVSLIAFAGLGNNRHFFQMLKENGWTLEESLSFRDHYSYSEKDIERLISLAGKKVGKRELLIATTEKDYMRLKNYRGLHSAELQKWIYFPVEVEWLSGKDNFIQLLNEHVMS